MINNSFIKLYQNYEENTLEENTKLFQEIENSMALSQGRNARTVVTKLEGQALAEKYALGPSEIDERHSNRKLGIFPWKTYSENDPNRIYMLNSYANGMDALKDLIKAGFKAYLHDFLNDKADLKLVSANYSKFDIFTELSLKDKIKKLACDSKYKLDEFYDDFYFEEKLVQEETATYMVKMFLESIETLEDIEAEASNLLYLIDDVYLKHENFYKDFESDFGTYKDFLNIVFNSLSIEEQSKTSTEAATMINASSKAVIPNISKGTNTMLKDLAEFAKAYFEAEDSQTLPEKRIEEIKTREVEKTQEYLKSKLKIYE